MVTQLINETTLDVIYPDSDGEPMADNTRQFRWIVVIKENLEILFSANPDIFVAGDLLWYPVEGNNKIRQAPDVMVIFGRPKGDRGSYRQWQENNIAPQVVFEILSPGNRRTKMNNKLNFYKLYGVEEYYIYAPDKVTLTGYIRRSGKLEKIAAIAIDGWISPRLGIRFNLTTDTLEIYSPSGERFLTSIELNQLKEQELQRAELERQRAELERQRAELEHQRAESAITQLEEEQQRYQALIERLRGRGIDTEQ